MTSSGASCKRQFFVPLLALNWLTCLTFWKNLPLMGRFQDLKAYQQARQVALLSRPLIARLPQAEHDLADQWRRASNSAVLNLAEGASRRGAKEFRRYADVARASLHEVEAIIDLAVSMGYLRPADVEHLCAVRDECARMVFGLIRKLGAASANS